MTQGNSSYTQPQYKGNTLTILLLMGTALLVSGILMFLSLFGILSGDFFQDKLNSFVYGLGGFTGYLIPAALIWGGIILIRMAKYRTRVRYFILFLLILLIFQGLLNTMGSFGVVSFFDYLCDFNQKSGIANKDGFAEMWRTAMTLCAGYKAHGGAMGLLLSYPLWYHLGNLYATILLITAAVLCLTVFSLLFFKSGKRKHEEQQQPVVNDYTPKESFFSKIFGNKNKAESQTEQMNAAYYQQSIFPENNFQPQQSAYPGWMVPPQSNVIQPVQMPVYYTTDPNHPGMMQPVMMMPNMPQQYYPVSQAGETAPAEASVVSSQASPELSKVPESIVDTKAEKPLSEEQAAQKARADSSRERTKKRLEKTKAKKEQVPKADSIDDSEFFRERSLPDEKHTWYEDVQAENKNTKTEVPSASYAPKLMQFEHAPTVAEPVQTENPVQTVPSHEMKETGSAIKKELFFDTNASEQPVIYPFAPELLTEDESFVEASKPSKAETSVQTAYAAGEGYIKPPIELLRAPSGNQMIDYSKDQEKAQQLERMFEGFRIAVKVMRITHGPSVSRFEIGLLQEGVNISSIVNKQKNIEMALKTTGTVQIEEHIPGTNLFGIYVPNETRQSVTLREILESDTMRNAKSPTAVALGYDINGKAVICDLCKMPHLMVAGTTGSGKSVCMNGMITSLLYRTTPAEVRLILIDPKMVEFSMYESVPHLLIPVVNDPHKASGALMWAVGEMEDRYARFAAAHVRALDEYNASISEDQDPLPRILIFIDELADLMMTCQKDVEASIVRLAQKARAAGIHMVLATQRPDAKIITGLIRSNINSRIALKVANGMDSRIILDETGAETLLGNGDMIYKYAGIQPIRLQGCFISDDESKKIIDFIQAHSKTQFDENAVAGMEANAKASQSGGGGDDDDDYDLDDRIEEAIELVLNSGQASASMLQRRMGVGYPKAGKLIDDMAKIGIVSESTGNKPRNILMTRDEYELNKEYLLGHKKF